MIYASQVVVGINLKCISGWFIPLFKKVSMHLRWLLGISSNSINSKFDGEILIQWVDLWAFLGDQRWNGYSTHKRCSLDFRLTFPWVRQLTIRTLWSKFTKRNPEHDPCGCFPICLRSRVLSKSQRWWISPLSKVHHFQSIHWIEATLWCLGM